jgi:outer membrane lipoprotein-sorting protein
VQTSDLGLPQLPTTGPGSVGATSLASLLTGSHTLRVWLAGDTKQRVALLGTLGESDVVRNGRDAWLWSSEDRKATHYRLPAAAATSRPEVPLPSGVTPQEAAEQALAAIDPTTSVTTDGTGQVAGRDAYELVLAPKDSRALVGQVRLAVDAQTSVPLRVQVFGKNSGNGPAFSVGFTSVSFDVPGASQFAFNPPPGAKVTEGTFPTGAQRPSAGAAGAKQGVTTVGTGWTTVAVLPDTTGQQASDGTLGTFLNQLPRVSGSWGSGRLLTSALVSALLTDDGRLIVGLVPPELLYAAAGK